MFDRQPIRREHETKDNQYGIRAELPRIDPARDVDASTRDRALAIMARRGEKN